METQIMVIYMQILQFHFYIPCFGGKAEISWYFRTETDFYKIMFHSDK